MLIRIMGCKKREENINKMLEGLPKETQIIWDEKKDVTESRYYSWRWYPIRPFKDTSA